MYLFYKEETTREPTVAGGSLHFLLEGQLSGRRAKNKNQKMYQDISKTKSFNDAVRYALEPHYDIGLVSLWSSDNYGTCLTYFALYHVLKDLGYTLALFDRSLDAPYAPLREKIQSGKVGLFQHSPYETYELIAPSQSRAEMRAQAEKCDTILVGSDQLFRNSLYQALGHVVSLDWVPSYKKKIAYAASWGNDEMLGTTSEKQHMKYYLDRFDAFSVREQGAVKLLKDECSVDVQQVLDPVFLCGLERYHQLMVGFDQDLKKTNYLFSYILGPSYEKEQMIVAFRKALNLDATVVTDAFYASSAYEHNLNFHHVSQASEEKWLAYFCNSEFIITDFNLTCGFLQPIDYNRVDVLLNGYKEQSMKWLQDALSTQKNSGVTDMDVVRENIDWLQIRLSNLEKFFGALEQRVCLIEQFARDLEQRTSAVESHLREKDKRRR